MAQKINRTKLFNQVVAVLKKNPYGLSSSDLARIMKINRMTLVKYLALMRAHGIVEFKNIGMAKVWHTSSKYDIINSITRDEAGSIQALVAGRALRIRNQLTDDVPLSLFRAVKAAMAMSKNANKALYEAGQFIANNCLVKLTEKDPNIIMEHLQNTFYNLNLGILEAGQISPSMWVLNLHESATAHGTTIKGSPLCHFEAGLISGVLTNALNKNAVVQETKCIGTSYTHCEFVVKFSR